MFASATTSVRWGTYRIIGVGPENSDRKNGVGPEISDGKNVFRPEKDRKYAEKINLG